MLSKAIAYSLLAVGIALTISGALAYSRSHPSPHFYVELVEAVPRIVLGAGILLFTGASLLLKRRRLRHVLLALAGSCAILGIVHWLFLYWVLISES